MAVVFLDRRLRVEGEARPGSRSGTLLVTEWPEVSTAVSVSGSEGRAGPEPNVWRWSGDSRGGHGLWVPLGRYRPLRVFGRVCRLHLLREEGLYLARTLDEAGASRSVMLALEGGEAQIAALGNQPLYRLLSGWTGEVPGPGEVFGGRGGMPEGAKLRGPSALVARAERIRRSLYGKATRAGLFGLARFLLAVRDPAWYEANAEAELNQVSWPRASQLDFDWIVAEACTDVVAEPPFRYRATAWDPPRRGSGSGSGSGSEGDSGGKEG